MKETMNAKSLEEVIRWFLKERRKRLLEEVFGVDRNRVKPFLRNIAFNWKIAIIFQEQRLF